MEQLNLKTELGNIYYKYNIETDDFDILRVIAIQNAETVRCIKNGNSSDSTKISVDELKSGYTRLLSDGVVSLSNVIVMDSQMPGRPLKDVIVMLHKRNENRNFSDPDVVCRQSITDFFNMDPSKDLIGVSVSKESIPAGIDMEDVIYCDKVLNATIMNVYKNDTLDFIMMVLKNKEADDILKDLYDVRLHHFQNIYKEPDSVSGARVSAEGYNKDVKSLLLTNNFMYDFYQAFGVSKVTFEIPFDENNERNYLPNDLKDILNNLYKIAMDKAIVVKYDFDIDFEEMKMPYLLVMDKTNTLYIVAYTTAGEFLKCDIKIDANSKEEENIVNKIRAAVDYYDKYSAGQNVK